jgi:hypothetical protein
MDPDTDPIPGSQNNADPGESGSENTFKSHKFLFLHEKGTGAGT